MTTIADLDTGQVLGIVDGRDSEDVGDWLFARPLQWRLGVQVVAIDPSAAFRKSPADVAPAHRGLGRRVPPGQVGNDMLTEVRQRLTQQVHGRRGRSIDPVWANRRLLLRGGDTLSDRARNRLSTVFATDDATGKLQAAWLVKEQLRTLLATGSHADAAATKDRLQGLVEQAGQPQRTGSGERSAGGGRKSKSSSSPARSPRR
jgi:transposase